MSEDAKNKQCQICKGYLFEEDDVVVCPHCGAPHHRDCWNTVGHCGVEEFHDTEKQYNLLKDDSSAGEENNAEQVNTCPRCHRTSKASGAEFCPYCGQPYNGGHQGFVNGMPNYDPYGGLPKNTTIDGARVEDIATFVGSNSARYVNRFSTLNKNKKGSWNWAAFIFPAGWCFARKMIPQGILYLILQISATLCALPFSENINDIAIANELNGYEEIFNYLMNNQQQLELIPLLLAAIGFVLLVLPRIFCGRLGDWHYKCFAIEKIKKILDNDEIVDKEEALFRAGNVNVLLLMLAYFLAQLLPTIIYSLI